jgi:preprotein translocase subunit SecF
MHRFHFSVGSFSIVSSELKKETVFFEQQVSNKHHRLVAVKEHISLPTRRTTVGTRFSAHFRFSEDDYIDCACLIVVVVVSFEFETTVASVSIALLVLVYVKPGWW